VAPRDRSCTRRDRSGGGAFALTRWGKCCYDPMLVSALSRCCLGVGMLVGFVWGQAGGERGFGCVSLVGVAPRDRSCTRRDRSGGGAIALTRWGEVLLRSYARFGPVPLLLGCRDVGGVCLGIGWWRAGFWLCASWGGSAGQVLHSQGSLGGRGFRADALGEVLLRSNARFGPVPLLLGCRDVGGA
jgi:hypothetical protein